MIPSLTLQEIREATTQLTGHVVRTPVHRLRGAEVDEAIGAGTQLHLKLELLQLTGTFKARGALLNVLGLPSAARDRGVTAISAGNHAIAVAFAAAAAGVSAKVVMIATANPLRVALCRSYGAEIVFAPDAHAGFAIVEKIAAEEGRTFVHPFEGRTTALGTATLGLELAEQLPDLQAVIVPIGGGGLCAGVASALKLMNPHCEVIGVEPFGADSMYRSFAAGEPRSIERVATIADSLGAPYALPISFELCRRNVDELVRVSDDELRSAMRFLLRNAKLAVEPAGAAATAALLGPVRERLRGKRVAAIVCGSNIDEATYAKLIS
ncbi:MAG TPA: pyridoxal-phosphate dependent enzyme [Steroidobacteraceae bacterium]|nr:pyridoxal-phosphate dependent enzyme [Steroidobacteraceae bacterium]